MGNFFDPDPTRATRVAIARDPSARAYPPIEDAPYHPSESYPEYTGPIAARPNHAYRLVRQALAELGLDAERFGSPEWNPIGALVPPGARIVIKPNWVLHANEGVGGTDCLVTHASVLRAIADYALRAKPASLVVGDAPIQVCRFDGIQALGFSRVAEWYRAQGAPVVVKDFRRTVMDRSDRTVVVHEDQRSMDDFVLVDLGTRSRMEALSGDAKRFRVTMYDPRRLREHHRPGVHEYLVSRDILAADLVINVPKLKSHKKAGLTIALKNLVGINGLKDYLPHHRKGGADRRGDNYAETTWPKRIVEELLDFANRHLDRPRLYARITRFAYRVLFFDRIRGKSTDVEGGWFGNDTVWRMCLDLNAILLYADEKAALHPTPRRRLLHIADAIIAGEGDGPLKSDPYPMGAVLASMNASALDWMAAHLVGFDPARIPITREAFGLHPLPISSVTPDALECAGVFTEMHTPMKPAAGWQGHIERSQSPGPALDS
ncbi:MAG TPA: DUF362 domain-containing protein [Kiritimatiellia bacterium]|nr:DUF362 domain-containing protein [Kiritimatiellia bacterium]